MASLASGPETSHTVKLPQYPKAGLPAKAKSATFPTDVALEWITSFEKTVSGSQPLASFSALIVEDGWWRDHLALSWEFHTLRGLEKINNFVLPRIEASNLCNLKLRHTGQFAPHRETPVDGLEWIEFMILFETASGHGKGIIRLVEVDCGNSATSWKAHMVYTSLQDLHAHPESVGTRRPHGGKASLGQGKGNWADRRCRQIGFTEGEDPSVLIVGAGQAGLAMAARLQVLCGVSCLVIDKNPRIGDNWRNRYRTLVTHDLVQVTHLPYMDFPPNWPLFTPKDKLAEWFEIYAKAMELNVWVNSGIQNAEFDEATQGWTVDISRGGDNDRLRPYQMRTIRPKHIVWATGQSGEPKMPDLPGQDDVFQGVVYHASQHDDAASLLASLDGLPSDKKVVVVGTGNSGHDIAQDFCESGAASVTMVQRSGTYVITAQTGLVMIDGDVYPEEGGPGVADMDVYIHSLPLPVQFALDVPLTQRIKEAEREVLDGLEAVGFQLDFGHDGSGLNRKFLTRGGGYYIDVGASRLLIDGHIKVVQSPDGLQGFEKTALILADGRRLEADVVVMATGFDNMRTTLRKTLGAKVADRCGDVWDLDEEGEINTIWRPSGHPNMWFMGGSLALTRAYSRFLALQIQAALLGLK